MLFLSDNWINKVNVIMKYTLIGAFSLLASLALSQPLQTDVNRLDQDPVFTIVLSRRLNYPIANAEKGYTKSVCARFDIDEKGHVQEITILNPALEKGLYFQDFDTAVKSALKRLPPLHPHYSGKYILPVLFSLQDEETGQSIAPINVVCSSQPGIVLLKSVKVVGNKSYKRGISPEHSRHFKPY
ncbi:energy transducer TonB [Spirosoma gilvum]